MTYSATAMTAVSAAEETHIRGAKKATGAACFGTFLEYYDFSCYGYVATLIAAEFFPSSNPTTSLLSALAVFASAFLARPLGGLVFGRIGDSYGRRTALLATVLLMGIASGLIGILPNYHSIGVAAPVLLVILRLLQGLSAGGEIGGAASYIREWAPPEKRALYISFIPGIAQIGKAFAAGAAGFAAYLFIGTDSPSWAWRIPFLLAVPLMLGCIYIRLKVEDSPEFSQLEKSGNLSQAPVSEILANYKMSLLKLTGFSLVQNCGTYVGTVYVAIYMQNILKIPKSDVGFIVLICITCVAFLIPLCGQLTVRVGARKSLVLSYLCYIVLCYPMYRLMGANSFALTIVAFLVTLIPYALCQAGSYSMYPELLPTKVRSTGVAFGHSCGTVLGGGAMPYLATWLIDRTGDIMVPTYIFIINGLLGLILVAAVRLAPAGDTRKYM